jgi:hypothetical protein
MNATSEISHPPVRNGMLEKNIEVVVEIDINIFIAIKAKAAQGGPIDEDIGTVEIPLTATMCM